MGLSFLTLGKFSTVNNSHHLPASAIILSCSLRSTLIVLPLSLPMFLHMILELPFPVFSAFFPPFSSIDMSKTTDPSSLLPPRCLRMGIKAPSLRSHLPLSCLIHYLVFGSLSDFAVTLPGLLPNLRLSGNSQSLEVLDEDRRLPFYILAFSLQRRLPCLTLLW